MEPKGKMIVEKENKWGIKGMKPGLIFAGLGKDAAEMGDLKMPKSMLQALNSVFAKVGFTRCQIKIAPAFIVFGKEAQEGRKDFLRQSMKEWEQTTYEKRERIDLEESNEYGEQGRKISFCMGLYADKGVKISAEIVIGLLESLSTDLREMGFEVFRVSTGPAFMIFDKELENLEVFLDAEKLRKAQWEEGKIIHGKDCKCEKEGAREGKPEESKTSVLEVLKGLKLESLT